MTLLAAASADLSVFSLPKVPSVPRELRMDSTMITGISTLLALKRKALSRSQERSRIVRPEGR